MGVLDRAMRQQLLDALESIPMLDATNGRNLLLQDLPPALVAALERDQATAIDLANIVNTCDAWGPAPLHTMIENALNLIVGSTAAGQLRVVLDTLDRRAALVMALPPPPAEVTQHQDIQHAPGSQPDPGEDILNRDRENRHGPLIIAFFGALALAVIVESVGSWVLENLTGDTAFNNLADWLRDIAEWHWYDWILTAMMVTIPAFGAAVIFRHYDRRFNWTWFFTSVIGAAFAVIIFAVSANTLGLPTSKPRSDFTLVILSYLLIAIGVMLGAYFRKMWEGSSTEHN